MQASLPTRATDAGADGRYATLDGLRGIAALLVAVYHLQQRLGLTAINGHLSVDLFFALSGFVLARVYSERFAQGLTAKQFTLSRFARFYPLYALGFLLGIAVLVTRGSSELSSMGFGDMAAAILLGGMLLPTPFSETLFPLNPAAWSLFFELAVNLLFAAWLWRLRDRSLLLVIGIALAALAVTTREPYYMNMGWGWNEFAGGCARTLFSFAVGMLIWRGVGARPRRESPFGLILPLLALLPIVLMVGDPKIWMLMAVVAFFPLLVALGTMVEPPAWARKALCALGALSFPLYAIHWPLAALMEPWLEGMAFSRALALFLASAMILAYAAQRLIDEPAQLILRRWLRSLQRPRAPSVTTISPLAQ